MLLKESFIVDVIVAGSIRRRKERVGDIDLVVVTTAEYLPEMHCWEKVRGGNRIASYIVKGTQVDMWRVNPNEVGAMLLQTTGSAELNILMRRKARVKGWLLNGYGLFEGGMAIARSEEAIFRGLEMTYMKPWERDVTFRTGLEAVKPWELAGVTS
jgi:DNA polymerase (family 10)